MLGFSTTLQKFQSTLPRGERQVDLNFFHAICAFQSTLPRGERPPIWKNLMRSLMISIHAPARGATMLIFPWTFYDHDFNPRSREGSDLGYPLYGRYIINISIHAPARGATGRHKSCCGMIQHFNPRSREGSDDISPSI